MIGTTVSHYKILEKLGEGGMGVVYKAHDTTLNRIVALKFLSSNVTTNDIQRERFFQEARAASALNHPNVCNIHSIGEYEGHDFIDMEYIEGETIRDKIASGKLIEDEILLLAIQIGDALQEAHAKGIIHRDIKSENIMVNKRNQTKVMDFGLAKLKGTSKSSGTIGTIGYMAPEQIQGGDVDGRADIFSFGVVLYEMCAGRLPFRGDHDAAMMYSILNEDPAEIPRNTISHQSKFEFVIHKMLEKDPANRFQTMNEVLRELNSFSSYGNVKLRDPENVVSIAVLPFADLSPAKDQEYFCDGIAEEIINALTKIKGLQVAARTSAFAFKGKNQDIRDIGSKLNVTAVLEGSLRKAGKRLRITTQLINVSDGYHLWSGRYDREEEDIFAIQDEISQAVVRAMEVKLIGNEGTSALSLIHTKNIEAYNLYLQGRYEWGKRTPDGLRKSIEYFQEAIKTDSDYALAYSALADSYCLLCSYHLLSPEESIPEAKKAALKSSILDPFLSEAHEALGHVMMLYDYDWDKAIKEYSESIAINPYFSTAHQRNALLKTVLGYPEEAMDEILKAEKLDPLSLIIITDTALMYYIREMYKQSIEVCKRALAMNPNFYVAHFVMGLAFEQSGEYSQAEEELGKAIKISGNNSIIRSSLAHCFGLNGKWQEAVALIEELEQEKAKMYVSSYSIAIGYIGLGKIEQALLWLTKAVDEHSIWHIHLYMFADPRLKQLRTKEEFIKLQNKVYKK